MLHPILRYPFDLDPSPGKRPRPVKGTGGAAGAPHEARSSLRKDVTAGARSLHWIPMGCNVFFTSVT